MVTSCSPKMPKTVEGYQKLAQRDLELIEAQRDEIAKLKGTVNDLRQKLKSKTEIHVYKMDEGVFSLSQEPLGEEFAKVLYENLWDLYDEI